MTELPQNPEQIEIDRASEEEVKKFLLHFADRPGDDAGSNDHTRTAVAAMLAAEAESRVSGGVETIQGKWDIAYTAIVHHSILNELVDNVSSGRQPLAKVDFDKYYDALWRMHKMRTQDG